ncbi:MAG: hypothetical protein K2R98_19195 [Gemmataceae bacterium]|nr:hypothetical protein [Gemmataceae bacterium]
MRFVLRLAMFVSAVTLVVSMVGAQVVPDPNKVDENKIRLNMLTKFAKDGKFTAKVVGDVEEEGCIAQVDYEYQKFSAGYQDALAKYNEARAKKDFNTAKALYGQMVEMGKKNQIYELEKIPLQFKITFKTAAKADDKKTPDKKDKKDAKEDKTDKKEADKKEADKDDAPKSMVIFRRMQLPPKDPENPKATYTLAEQKELKGDPKLVGWKAESKDIDEAKEMPLIFYIAKTFKAPVIKAPVKGKEKKDDEEMLDLESIELPVIMIVIPPPPKEGVGNPLIPGAK